MHRLPACTLRSAEPAVTAALLLATFAIVPHAAAQDVTTEAKWEMDVHLGVVSPIRGGEGRALQQFPIAETFETVSGTGVTTRAISSWLFGEGAALFNLVSALNGVPASIVPLDPALRAGAARRRGGPGLGFTVARWLWPRLAIQLQGDYSLTSAVMDERALAAVEATALSFADAWNLYLQGRVAPGGTASDVGISADADRGRGHELRAIAELKVVLRQKRRSRLYVAGGLGVSRTWSRPPSATLTGAYAFFGGVPTSPRAVRLVPFSERDDVAIRVRLGKARTPVGSIRGGFEYYQDSWRGVRVDVAILVSRHSVTTLLDAHPTVATEDAGGTIAGTTDPTIQFSSSADARSTLSGPAIDELVTSSREGALTHAQVSVGYFWRF